MTQEEKQLLLQDLCERLPYDTIASVTHYDEITKEEGESLGYIKGVTYNGKIEFFYLPDYTEDYGAFNRFSAENIKPYLRHMSSMTEEELNECVCQSGIKDIECPNWQDIPKEKQFEARLNHAIAVFLTDSNNVDWLNAHHFDYRGLIGMGLALEAPEGMYNF